MNSFSYDIMLPFYAHTTQDDSPWEPLFTLFSEPNPIDPAIACSGKNASAITHYEIEFIHPFPDGNGRIGRLW